MLYAERQRQRGETMRMSAAVAQAGSSFGPLFNNPQIWSEYASRGKLPYDVVQRGPHTWDIISHRAQNVGESLRRYGLTAIEQGNEDSKCGLNGCHRMGDLLTFLSP